MEELTKLCPGCGSALVFNPETGALYCPSCKQSLAEIEEDSSQIKELNLLEQLQALEEAGEEVERLTIHCDACGAENVFDENVVTDKCAFCGVPLSAQAHSSRIRRPQGLVPFTITQEKAKENFCNWLTSLWFLPNRAKECKNTGAFRGIYRPYWTYDFNTVCEYSGARGDYYYVNVTYTTRENGKTVTRTRQERRTRWTNVYGTVNNSFDDVLVSASTLLTEKEEMGLAPWNLSEAVNYNPDLIRGFREESYDVTLANGLDTAKARTKGTIENTVRNDIGGDEQRIHDMSISYFNLTCKHLLLPIWLDSFRYDGRVFKFLVNGQTGKVQGERPWSAVKITFFVLFLLAIAGIIIFFIVQAN